MIQADVHMVQVNPQSQKLSILNNRIDCAHIQKVTGTYAIHEMLIINNNVNNCKQGG